MPPYEVTTGKVLGGLLKLPHPSPGITVQFSHQSLRVKGPIWRPSSQDYRGVVGFRSFQRPDLVRSVHQDANPVHTRRTIYSWINDDFPVVYFVTGTVQVAWQCIRGNTGNFSYVVPEQCVAQIQAGLNSFISLKSLCIIHIHLRVAFVSDINFFSLTQSLNKTLSKQY